MFLSGCVAFVARKRSSRLASASIEIAYAAQLFAHAHARLGPPPPSVLKTNENEPHSKALWYGRRGALDNALVWRAMKPPKRNKGRKRKEWALRLVNFTEPLKAYPLVRPPQAGGRA